MPDLFDGGERKVETDREQQQHDPDLGERFDPFRRVDDAQPAGAGDDTRQHQGDDGRHAQPRKADHQDEANGKRENEIGEDGVFDHPVSGRTSSSAP